MNSEASALGRKLDAAIAAQGGLDAFRCHAVQHLKVKAVVKESHCCQINALAVNTSDATCRNLFATAARGQVTIYDDQHMGDHIAVVAQYAAPLAGRKPIEMLSCAWLPAQLHNSRTHEDAWLAVGGSDRAVIIISVAEAAVVRRLAGHDADPITIVGCQAAPRLLLVLCKDGSIRLWDVKKEACLAAALKSDAFSATLSPCGSFFFTGTRSGGLHCWQPAAREAEPPAAAEIEQPPCGTDDQQQQQNQQQHQEQPQRTPQQNPSQGQQQQQVNQQQQRLLQQEARVLAMWDSNQPRVNEQVDFQGLGLGVALEGLNFLKGGRLLVRCSDGRMLLFDWSKRTLLCSWRVPGCNSSRGVVNHSSKCGFGHTSDGRTVCAGNPQGHVFIYDANNGAQLACLEPYRAPTGPVRGCGVSEDGRHVLVAAGNGYLFRYEYQWPAGTAEAARNLGLPDHQQVPDQHPPDQQQQPSGLGYGAQDAAAAAGAAGGVDAAAAGAGNHGDGGGSASAGAGGGDAAATGGCFRDGGISAAGSAAAGQGDEIEGRQGQLHPEGRGKRPRLC